MDEYPKIYGPFKRATEGPNRNRVIHGDWARLEFAILASAEWLWTEKVDGTNIRVHWDGHAVTFGGRTDNASIPAKLVTLLRDTFPEELFEQAFGDTVVTLYGEGFGAGVQKGGGRYRPDGVGFVLFDVRIGGFWLLRASVADVALKLGVEWVPVIETGTVWRAIELVSQGIRSRWNPDMTAEGLVGVPYGGLLARDGSRIAMKVKTADFHTPPPAPQDAAQAKEFLVEGLKAA